MATRGDRRSRSRWKALEPVRAPRLSVEDAGAATSVSSWHDGAGDKRPTIMRTAGRPRPLMNAKCRRAGRQRSDLS